MYNNTKEHDEIREKLKSYFPLHPAHEYETTVNQGHYPIGVNQNYPAELRNRLSAATISYIAGNKSIDYVRKKYSKTLNYKEDIGGSNRKDRIIRTTCLTKIQIFIDGIVAHRSQNSEEGTIGEFLSDATIVRLHYSLQRAFAEADKGALFEALVIIRMALEQLCWAISIHGVNDPDEIKKTSATKSITKISRDYPRIGRLNGWLSKHAHWNYEGHIKVAFENMGYSTIASYMFKACAYASLLVYTDLFVSIVGAKYNDFIDWSLIQEGYENNEDVKRFDCNAEFEQLSSMLIAFYPDLNVLKSKNTQT